MRKSISAKRQQIRTRDAIKRWLILGIAALVIVSMLLADLSYIFL